MIGGGALTLVSSDDGINAAGGVDGSGTAGAGAQDQFAAGDNSVTITGGTLVVDADGDGLDSNGSMTLSGGTIVVDGPTNSGNGSLDVNGTFDVSGGVLVAVGSSGMVVSPGTDSAQGWISATFDSVQEAGTVVNVVSSDGTVVASFTSAKEFQPLVVSSAVTCTRWTARGDPHSASRRGRDLR